METESNVKVRVKNDQNELNEESREKQEVRKKTSNEQRDTQRIK